MAKIRIEVVSDVVCPWCYIGKVRLEKAVDALQGDGTEFDIHYLPFELNPGTPDKGVERRAHLIEKFGGEERYNALQDHVSGIAATEGLTFHMEAQKTVPNTRKAHVLIDFAGSKGRQDELVNKLFQAYFSDGIDLTEDKNLINLGTSVGLDQNELETVLKDSEAAKRIKDQEEEMYKLGISGVPFYIINGKYGISGAQPTEIFIKALAELRTQIFIAEVCDLDAKNC